MTRLEQRVLEILQRDFEPESPAEGSMVREDPLREPMPWSRSPTKQAVGPSDSFLDLVDYSPDKVFAQSQFIFNPTSRQTSKPPGRRVDKGTSRNPITPVGISVDSLKLTKRFDVSSSQDKRPSTADEQPFTRHTNEDH